MPTLTHSVARAMCLAVLWLPVAGCNREDGGQTGDEDTQTDSGAPDDRDAFVRLAGSAFGNYQPARTLAELVEWSDVVAVARAVRLEQGRTFLSPIGRGGEPNRTPTVVMHLDVLEALKGEPGETLYLEFIVGNAETLLSSELPDQRVLVLAEPAHSGNLISGGSIEDAGRGLPEGATLREPTTPQGFAAETADGVLPVFERTDTLLLAESMDALVERVAMQSQ